MISISNEELERKLSTLDEVSFVKVDGDGYKYQVTVVSDTFATKTKVARQQWVYKQLGDYITSGKVHALSMNTWTKEEWEKHNG